MKNCDWRVFLSAIILFIVNIPDTDVFVANLNGTVSFLSTFGILEPRFVARYHGFATIALLSICVTIFHKRSIKYDIFPIILFVLCVIQGVAKGILVGDDAFSALFSNRSIATCAFGVSMILGMQSHSHRSATIGGIVGMISAVCVREGYSVLKYFSDGGVQIVTGVNSVTADGGLLFLAGFIIYLIYVVFAEDLGKNVLAFPSALYIVGFGMFFVQVGSFRRLSVLMPVLLVILYIVLDGIAGKRLLYGVIKIFPIVVLGLVFMFVFSNLVFNSDTIEERVRSLNPFESSELGTSNNSYLGDWRVFPELFGGHPFVGWGYTTDYGITREVEATSIGEHGTLPPLHVGLFEVWVTHGLIGLVLHCYCFLFIPMSVITRQRKGKIGSNVKMYVIPLLILEGLIPFQAPIFVNVQMCVLVGICVGMACSPTPQADGKCRW